MGAPENLLAAFLKTVESTLVPLTRDGVTSGSKVFGAAIFSKADLKELTVATNDERVSPLLHGEINCIQKFFTVDFPDTASRSKPQDCIFFATHEPCSLCLSGIAWAGFKEFYYMFTYEDTRDLFSIPYDIDILEEVFRVRGEGETDEEEMRGKPLYNRHNKYFHARSLADLAADIEDAEARRKWTAEMERVKGLYDSLGSTYQTAKERGAESSSTWR